MTHAAAPITRRDAFALALIATVWGVNTALTKYVLLHLSPLFSSCIRFALTAALLFMFWRPAPGTLRPLIVVGLLTSLHFGVQAVGLWLADDLSPMVVAMQLWIPAAAVLAAIFLHERSGLARMIGVGVSFGGTALLAGDGAVIPQLGAFVLVGVASTLYGAVSVYVRGAPALHPLAYQAWIAIAALATLGPLSIVTERNQMDAAAAAGWGPFAALAFAAVASSIVANALMFQLVRKYEVSRTTPYMFLSPVIAISLGIVFFDDPISPQLLIGAALTLLGVAIVTMAERLAILR